LDCGSRIGDCGLGVWLCLLRRMPAGDAFDRDGSPEGGFWIADRGLGIADWGYGFVFFGGCRRATPSIGTGAPKGDFGLRIGVWLCLLRRMPAGDASDRDGSPEGALEP
jgi:hypothetical protein